MPSGFEFHISSPFRPSFAERNAVLQEIESLQESEDQVDAAIALEEARLASLRREGRLLTREIEHRRAYLAPIRLVPFEVLGHIFELYLEEISARIVHLQLVSRSWCAVTNNYPSLWTRINVVGPFCYSGIDPYKQYINKCTKRSGTLPLHVVFESNTPFGATTGCTDAGTRILEYLCIVSNSRWTSFSCTFTPDCCYTALTSGFLLSVISQAPKLQHLRLSGVFISPVERRLTCQMIQKNWRQLRSLDIRSLAGPPLDISIPLPQIRDLVITGYFCNEWNAKAAEHWLHFFPLLRTLTITSEDNPWSPTTVPKYDTYDAMYISDLTTIGTVPPWAFDGVTFPALKRINIVAYGGYSGHFLNEKYAIEKITSSNPVQLTLTCSDCYPFWGLFTEVALADRLYNQHFVREILTRTPAIESVEASSCIWKQLCGVFDEQDEEIEEAGRHTCPHKTKIPMVKLQEYMSGYEPTTDGVKGDALYWRMVYGDYNGP